MKFTNKDGLLYTPRFYLLAADIREAEHPDIGGLVWKWTGNKRFRTYTDAESAFFSALAKAHHFSIDERLNTVFIIVRSRISNPTEADLVERPEWCSRPFTSGFLLHLAIDDSTVKVPPKTLGMKIKSAE